MKTALWCALAVAVLVVLAGAGASNPTAAAQGAPAESFVHDGFVRVIDGDTVEIWRDDSRWGIGYIDIDAPEGNTACGQAAIARQWELLGSGVRFTAKPGFVQDDQDRRPYYPETLDGVSIEEVLVREGLAKLKSRGKAPLDLRLAEAEARREGRGCVWDGRGGPPPTPRQFPERRTPSFMSAEPQLEGDASVSAAAITVPGFEDLLVAGGFNEPTTFDFAADGRMFVAEKSGKVWLYANGSVVPVPVLNIENQVNDYWDRGLIGMALDPQFLTNGFIYVAYAYENNATDYSGTKTARLSRFTVIGNVASPASEVVLMGSLTGSSCDAFPATADCIPSEGASHSVGNIRFGLDGKLYATFGDAASFNFVDDRALRVLDVNRLNGKLVRINTDGTGVSDNPFWDGNPNSTRSKVWAYGLRNAFRFNMHPARGSVYLGDVGWNEREEITVVSRGNNLGWPCYEGNERQAGYESKPACQSLYSAGTAAVKAPIYAWAHNEAGCCGAAAVGGAWATSYAPPYDDTYFFADYSKNWIRTFKTTGSDTLIGSPQPFMTNANGPVSMQRGPNGEIYYLAINTGEIRHIRQTGGNRTPAAVLNATPTDGLAPLNVEFSAAGSLDPDNDTLTFAWDFGDGTTGSGLVISHTYIADGSYTARLTVSDGEGGTDSKTTVIVVGNRRPVLSITSPADGSIYVVGQRISLSGSGTDPEDGALPPGSLTWDVTLHHNVHTHPFLSASGSEAFFDVPDHGDETYFVVVLKGVDSEGVEGETSITIRPQEVLFTLESSPPGLALTYDGISVTTPFTATTVANSSHTIGAPTPQGNAVFRSWSDGGAPSHNITLGTENESRHATFSVAQSIIFDDLANQDRPFSGTYPSAVATWPSGQWYLSGPWGALTTKSVSFLNSSQRTGTFTFVSPRVLLGFQVYNGGGGSSTITAACGTNPLKSQVVAVGQLLTVTTGWTAPCTTITMTSSNGWETNFDNFVHDADAGPDTTAPVISAVQTGSVTETTATVTWTTNEASSTQVEYGTSTAFGSFAPATPNLTPVTAHSQALSGLLPGTTYHYRVLSRDAAGNLATSDDFTFVTVAPDTTAPVISAVQAGSVTETTATVTWTTNEASSTQVEYGTSTAYGSFVPATPNLTPLTAHSQPLSGLLPGTTYHYRVLSRDAAGNLATSDDFTFITVAPDTTAPVISTVQAGSITETTAIVTWTTNEASSTQVEYGTSTSYGSVAPATPNLTPLTAHSQALSGLLPGTTYHYRVLSRDAAGNLATSADFTFITVAPDTTAPVISAVQAGSITETTATVTWTTNEASSTQVEYGTSTSYGSVAPATPNLTPLTAHSQALSGLLPGTTYHYRVLSRDAANNLATSADFTFMTTADTTGPVISGVQAGGIAQSIATITWATNEAGTSQVEYGPTTSYGTFVPVTPTGTLTTTHSQALSGLAPGVAYSFRVISVDASGNATSSENFTFTTTATGASLQFDGSNDRATVSDSNSLDLVGPMTLEAWVKFDALPGGKWQTIVFKQANSSSMAYAMYYYGGLWFEIRSGASNIIVRDDRPLQTGRWYHLAAVYDRVTMRLYVDGQQTASRAFTGAVVTSNLALTMGYNTVWSNEQLSGSIDEVRISKIARYSANFTPSGAFTTDADTVGLWHLDEGTGQTSEDASGNGNTLRRGANLNAEGSDPAWAAAAPLVIGALAFSRRQRGLRTQKARLAAVARRVGRRSHGVRSMRKH